MKRTASLNLDWKRDYEWNEWYANLPAIPGYPGTQTEGNSQIAVYSVKDGYCFEIIVVNAYDLPVTDGDHIYLYNSDFGIPDTETEDEIMDIVEERLTPEMIADALQAKGYTPGGIATASREASHRTASLDLDWSDQGIPQYEEAPLTFDIPGYEYDHAHSDVAITVREFMSDTFGFAFTIEGLKCPRGDYAQLWNDVDFGIPDGDTVEEMMQAAENITPQEIADALAANGYAPDDNTTAARKADKRTASLNLDWKPNIDGDVYTAILPDVPGFPVQSPSNWSTHCAQVYKWGKWRFDISLLIQRPQDLAYMDNDDFGIPDGDSAEEMMQAVENLSMDDIIFVLRQYGFMPVDDD